jgi:hypothetical protein
MPMRLAWTSGSVEIEWPVDDARAEIAAMLQEFVPDSTHVGRICSSSATPGPDAGIGTNT